MTDEGGSTLPRRQLGWHLRNGRNELGLTLEQVAAMMQWSKSKLARIEKAEGGGLLRELDIRELCRVLGFDDDMTTAMVELSRQSDAKCWWHTFDDVIRKSFNMYVGLESSATSLTMFRPNLVPGLLQTPDYARALDRIYFPDDTAEELDRRVQLRIKRQALIARRSRPTTLKVVLHESVLRTLVGGRKIMAAQCRHIADMSTRDNVDARILPFGVGFPLGLYVGPYVILDFGYDAKGGKIAPSVVFIEGYTGDMYLERVQDERMYRKAAAAIEHAALDAVQSRNLLRQIAREFAA
ncbi:helix-turn-helix domain-containing protein [Nocardia sp. NBC_00508]|uniref:helix-turn-helix domain-containing protein n=1 Tax=Nocardia sp. NBC_00508 TaxID=2975992 RepID=UPI002E809F8C|nr:helix-turn-helix transcriptional regulator [Nocardia sp. NBC_00508]WUD64101.1 helix-turn-helix domain-containing protein [Nocardia sp. NBC_00508]